VICGEEGEGVGGGERIGLEREVDVGVDDK
jgi:hypothetical protein